MPRLSHFWGRPEVEALISSKLPPREILPDLCRLAGEDAGMVTVQKVSRIRYHRDHTAAPAPASGKTSRVDQLKEALAEEIVGQFLAEMRAEKQRLQALIQEKDAEIEQLRNQVSSIHARVDTTEQFAARVLERAGLVNGGQAS